MMKPPYLSIVTPVFNEEESIHNFLDELYNVLSSLSQSYEVICVNDGSTDKTAELLDFEDRPYLTVLHLSRNFGHQAALLAGLEHAQGDIIISLDSDLQHPPSVIIEMLKKHTEGVDIVLTQRVDGEITSNFKKNTAHAFYSVINALTSQHLLENSSDYRSLTRRALDALLAMPERRKFLRGMVQWIGFTQVVIPYEVRKRAFGTSKYTLTKMMRLAVYGITSFSTLPLYFSAVFASVLFVFALLYAVYVLYMRLFVGAVVEGWASVLFVQLLIGGFVSLFLALLGIYIAAIYDEVKNRPQYILKEMHEKNSK